MSVDHKKTHRASSLEASRRGAQKPERQRKLSIIILISAVFSVYLVTLAAGFVYDDNTQVLTNRWIRDFRYIPEILTSSGTEFMGKKANTYRPLLHLAFMAEYYLWGLKPWGYHFVNIALHGANTVLVFLIAIDLFQPYRKAFSMGGGPRVVRFPGRAGAQGLVAPFFAAAFFAVHPINVEPVAWVSAIPELTYTFFLLLSFYLYIRSEGAAAPYAISVPSFFMALLSKETAVSLILLTAAYDFSSKGLGMVRGWRRYLPFIAALGAYAAIRTYSVGGLVHHRQADLSAFQAFLNVFPLLFQYSWKLLLPVDLKVIYIFKPAVSFADLRVLAGVALVVLGAIGAFLSRGNRAVFSSIFWMAVPVLPVLYIPALSNSAFAERYLYLPSAGFSMLLAYSIRGPLNRAFEGGKSARAAFALAAALLLVYSAATVKRELVWLDDLSLWKDTVAKAPDSRYAQYNLAVAYGAAKDHGRALEHYREAIRLDPAYVSAYYNLAWTCNELGDEPGAIENYKRVISLDPGASDAHYNLGLIYMKNGMLDEAVFEFEAAISIDPGYSEAKERLEETLLMKGL